MEVENLSGIAQHVLDLFFCPNVKRAFGGLCVAAVSARGYNGAVCVFGREKAAFLGCHVAADVIENIPRDCFVLPVPRDLKCIEISDRKLRLVVQHLFEVRHVPVTIDGVTMKSAADMIVHSAGGQFAQCEKSHI